MTSPNLDRVLHLYECLVLTAIAALLFNSLVRTPVPYTLEKVMNRSVDPRAIPVVRILGGTLDDVGSIGGTVDVSGTVSVER